MNWEAIGAIGELLGAAGVIATLGYLAIQIRQNTRTQSAASEQAKSPSFSGFHSYVAQSETLAHIWEKGFADETALTPDEKRRFVWMIADYFLATEGIFNQYSLGFVSADSWSQHERAIMGALNNPLVKRWWDNRITPLSYTFRNHVDQQMKKETPERWEFQKIADL